MMVQLNNKEMLAIEREKKKKKTKELKRGFITLLLLCLGTTKACHISKKCRDGAARGREVMLYT